jgi:hypothetical protein
MIIEKTGRTKICTDCGVIAHNTVMESHTCEIPVKKTAKPIKKTIKKTKK